MGRCSSAEDCSLAPERNFVRLVEGENTLDRPSALDCSWEPGRTLVRLGAEAGMGSPLEPAFEMPGLEDTLVDWLVQDQVGEEALLHFVEVLRAALYFREVAMG